VPPSQFERFSDEPLTLTHIALLARCIVDPNCADNLDLEGNKLVVPDADKRQETLTHLKEADELIGCGNMRCQCALWPAAKCCSVCLPVFLSSPGDHKLEGCCIEMLVAGSVSDCSMLAACSARSERQRWKRKEDRIINGGVCPTSQSTELQSFLMVRVLATR